MTPEEEIEKLKARVQVLQNVLRPLANMAYIFDEVRHPQRGTVKAASAPEAVVLSGYAVFKEQPVMFYLRVYHFQEALAALEEKKDVLS